MNKIEDRLNHSADVTRSAIDQVPDRSGAFVVARHRRRRASKSLLTAAAALVLVVGTTLLLTQANSNDFAATGQDQTSPPPISAEPDAPVPFEPNVTTTIVTPQNGVVGSGEGSRFSTRSEDEFDWQWATQVAASDWRPIALTGKLADVQASIPALAGSAVLASSATELSESAFFLLGDGSDAVVYVGWQEYDGELLIDTPALDEWFNVGNTDGYLVAQRLLAFTGDFVVDAGSEVATVRFFQLDDAYAQRPLEMSADDMSRLFNSVLDALALPDDAPGNLLDNAGPAFVGTVLPAAAPDNLVARRFDSSVAPSVISCQVFDDEPTVPNRSGTVGEVEAAASVEAALWVFLRASAIDEDRQGFATSGYVQTTLPDSTIVFSQPFGGVDSLSVTSIIVEPKSGGWAATSWEASGC